MGRTALRWAACAALAGCVAPAPPGGTSVALLREAMVESARRADVSDQPEPAVHAVAAWRESGGEGRDAGNATGTTGGMP